LCSRKKYLYIVQLDNITCKLDIMPFTFTSENHTSQYKKAGNVHGSNLRR